MDNAASHQPLVVLAENIARHCADGFQVTPEFCARIALMVCLSLSFRCRTFDLTLFSAVFT